MPILKFCNGFIQGMCQSVRIGVPMITPVIIPFMVVWLSLGEGVYGFSTNPFSAVPMDGLRKTSRMKTDDDVVREFQVEFIKSTFVNALVEDVSLLTDEEKEEFGLGVEQGFVKEMLKNQISNQLAEQDVFGMEKEIRRYLKQHQMQNEVFGGRPY